MNRGCSLFACAAVLGALSLQACRGVPERAAPLDAVDHVVVGVSSLQDGMRWIESLTGASPVAGGKHPHAGTHNAVLSLGPRQYLELVAARAGVEIGPQAAFQDELTEPTPLMWAVGTRDIRAVQHRLEFAGYETTGPVLGSRVRPDGVVVEWRTLHVTKPPIADAPFFIEWQDDALHPARTAPPGCRLVSFAVIAPNPSLLRRLLRAANVQIEVVQGPTAQLDVGLDSPRGKVRLGGRVPAAGGSGP